MVGLLVHDWISEYGGAEKVLDSFAGIFPDSHIYTLWNDAPKRYAQSRVTESWLAGTTLRHAKAAALPFMLEAWRNIPPTADYEWIIASSHLFAHHAKVRSLDIPKLVYAHTPARYIWEPSLDTRGSSLSVRAVSQLIKPLDRRRAREPVAVAANSRFVQDRIRRAWGIESSVIYPPVDVEEIQKAQASNFHLNDVEHGILGSLPQEFILSASRFVPYKRLDLAIEAAYAIDIPVVIAGSGPDEHRLREKAAGTNVEAHFITSPSTKLLHALYARAALFIFPAIEDFGIMPVEAMATGTPVLVNEIGGAGESMSMVSGGVALRDFEPSEWRNAFNEAIKIDGRLLAARTRTLGRRRFEDHAALWVEQSLRSI